MSPTDAQVGPLEPPAVGALVGLIRSIEAIETIELLRLTVPPSVEARPGALPQHAAYASEARRARVAGDSFTEAFLAAADHNDDLESALAVVDYHQPFGDAPFSVALPVAEFNVARVQALIAETPDDQLLVITSRVGTTDGIRHLPLLDFKIAAAPRNEPAVRAVTRRLGGGLLVNSGSSYHLYGAELVDDDALVRWLLHAQLFSRCVDTRWVTHQLLERRAALRISRGGSRNVHPRVIGHI